MIPLNIGTPEEFSALRGYLEEFDFREEVICKRAGLESIYQFKGAFEGGKRDEKISDPSDLLMRVFMDGDAAPLSQLEDHLSADCVRLMEKMGLLEALPSQDTERYASVFLYPTESLYVVSDRTIPLPGQKGTPIIPDCVYAAITTNTGRFLRSLPPEPCEDFLDLCSGTGIAAFVAARRYARHAWSCDVTGRAAHYAEFSRLLNGLDNVIVAQGDLYEPVGDRQFDRIAAHPPYIPAAKQQFAFRDGGEDGEQITRKIIQGLPQYLAPGGRFYCVTLASDREGETFEQRIRLWLGEKHSEFDVVLVASQIDPQPDIVAKMIEQGSKLASKLTPTTKLFRDLKVTALFYGTVVVERKRAARPPATARTLKAKSAGSETIEWFRRWSTETADPGFVAHMANARPVCASALKLLVTHSVQDGSLLPTEFELKIEYPFQIEMRCEPWVAVLVNHCDGTRTGRELFEMMKQQEVIGPNMTLEEFGGLLHVLVSNAVLELENFRLPTLPERRSQEAGAS